MAILVKINNLLIRAPWAYIKRASIDYRDAFTETGKKMIEHPIKTIFYTSNICLIYYAYQTMPTFNSYKNHLIEFQNQQLLTSNLIRNQKIELYIDTIQQLLAHDQIHFIDCFLFSLIIYRNQYKSVEHSYKFYENTCSYLNLKRNGRIIDIGLFNRWWRLNKQLRQADIF